MVIVVKVVVEVHMIESMDEEIFEPFFHVAGNIARCDYRSKFMFALGDRADAGGQVERAVVGQIAEFKVGVGKFARCEGFVRWQWTFDDAKVLVRIELDESRYCVVDGRKIALEKVL